jgi:hypothetical protein
MVNLVKIIIISQMFLSLRICALVMRKFLSVSGAALLGTVAAFCVLGFMTVWTTEDNRDGLLERKVNIDLCFFALLTQNITKSRYSMKIDETIIFDMMRSLTISKVRSIICSMLPRRTG